MYGNSNASRVSYFNFSIVVFILIFNYFSTDKYVDKENQKPYELDQ